MRLPVAAAQFSRKREGATKNRQASIPALRASFTLLPPRPLRALREAYKRRDEGRCLRAGFADRYSGGAGAPPGTTMSPCQELADRPARVGNGKRGPAQE
jgi:hypothetical protein